MAVVTDALEPLHPLTVDDYHRMMDAGILTEDDRVELLDGALFELSPEGPPHADVVARLARWLIRGLPDDAHLVRVGSPVTLRPLSEPQPDFAVVDASDSTWQAHPERAHLVVEVSNTSLRKDQVRKARIYSEHRIPRYWIVDLVHLCVHVHTEPGLDGYGFVETVHPPARLDPGTCGLPPIDLGPLLAA